MERLDLTALGIESPPPDLLVDSNTLVLYVVGWTDRRRIPRTKATASFDETAFDLLIALMTRFRAIVTTPNVLTSCKAPPLPPRRSSRVWA